MFSRLICILVSILMATTTNSAGEINPAPLPIWIWEGTQPQTGILEEVRKPHLQKGDKGRGLRREAIRTLIVRALDGLLKEGQAVPGRFGKGRAGDENHNTFKHPEQAVTLKDGLHLVYPAQFPAEIEDIWTMTVQDKLSQSERGLLANAFIAGKAKGLSNLEATLFAVRHVNNELTLEASKLPSRITLGVLAQAFKTAMTTASSRGMSVADATNFASAMLRVQAVSGLKTADIITIFADSFKRALVIGRMEGMDTTQATGFGSKLLPIQDVSGVQIQSDSTLLNFAKSFMSFWNVGVELGMWQDDVLRFATVMIQIQAGVGNRSLDRVRQDAQDFLGGVAKAISKGESPTMARTSVLIAILGRNGVNLTSGSNPSPVVNVRVKVIGRKAERDIDILNKLGKRVVTKLQLSSSSTRDEDGGGVLGEILQGRVHHYQSGGQIPLNHFKDLQYSQDSPQAVETRRFK